MGTVSGKAGTAKASSSMAEWSLLCQVKMAQYMGGVQGITVWGECKCEL